MRRSAVTVAMLLVGADASAASAALPVRCSATGTKLLVPPMNEAQVCARFIAALPGARAAAGGDALTVVLAFKPRGMASARAERSRHGRTTAWPLYELATSDRHQGATEIDDLAHMVARGMAGRTAKDGDR